MSDYLFEDIPTIQNFTKEEVSTLKRIVISIHGLNSSKESSTILALMDKMKEINIGVIALDLPGHGASKVKLGIRRTLDEIHSLEKKINEISKAQIGFFASSYGGYLILLYLAERKNRYEQVILRAPAIDLYKAISKGDYEAPEEFFAEVKLNSVFEIANRIKTPLHIIYGTKDTVVDNTEIFELSKVVECHPYPIENANHRFQNEGDLERILEIATKVFSY